MPKIPMPRVESQWFDTLDESPQGRPEMSKRLEHNHHPSSYKVTKEDPY